MARLHLKTAGNEQTALDLQQSGSHFIATIGDQRVEGEFEELINGCILLRMSGRVERCYVHRKGSSVQVWIAGQTYRIELVESSRRRSAAHAGPIAHEITAPMPGTILRIEAKPGDAFAAHQPLIIMESMKMEMTLSAPHEGRIGQIRCAVGELVPMGKVLATLEPQRNEQVSV